jgi:hypothetical protein
MIGAFKGAKNMTRETKVGLVVCCSFLCLVGVVLGCKLRGEGEQADADGPAVVEEPMAEPVSPPIAIRTTTPSSVGDRSASASVPAPPNVTPLETVKPKEVTLTPPPGNEGASQIQQVNGGNDNAGTTGVVHSLEVKQEQPVTSVAQTEQAATTEQPESVVRVAPAPAIADAAWTESTRRSLGEVPWPLPSRPTEALGAAVATPATERSSTTEQVVSTTSSGSETTTTTRPLPVQPAQHPADVELIAPPPPPPSSASTTGIPPIPDSIDKPATPGTPVSTPDTHTQAPGASLLPPVMPSTPSSGGERRQPGPAAGVMPPDRSMQVPSADDGPERHSAPSQAPLSGSTPPIGTHPTAVTPPITVPVPGAPVPPVAAPAASTTPKVEVFDEETYLCQPGDTFDKISLAHYHTENYAKALLQFNIDHPLASDKVRRNPPVLEPGQAVYIPPTRILESRYGAFYIPGYKPAPQDTAGPSSVTPTRNDHAVNASPGNAGNVPLGSKKYRVQGQGESMREIARATLGNAERWSEIYNLNHDFDPMLRIPGGTVLNLPNDARVDAANMPR